MKEEVIVCSLSIKQLGQKVYFQIPLPCDTKRIIGLEFGIMPDEGSTSLPCTEINPFFQIVENEPIGRLVLQVPSCERLFYQADLIKDNNIHYGENINHLCLPKLWTHGRKREEVSVSVFSADFVEGFFVNKKYDDDEYDLHLYLWLEKCAV